ncbi:VOC family protein [Cellulomonas sp. IC4_254]|uniref:VOC family protein n=1 Tax=Cellulomonas sp. IC4_254 TaxID=2714040 RepID=UPI001422F91D|nr:VOC family protein [Cellulomonas sp. IC4_254]
MPLTSIRLVTEDVDRLVAFYERVTGLVATRPVPAFAQLTGPGAVLAVAHVDTVARLGGVLLPAANRSVVVEFEVADVEAELARLDPDPADVLLPPTTMPWGNRSALLRDPDGNVVNLFSRPEA